MKIPPRAHQFYGSHIVRGLADAGQEVSGRPPSAQEQGNRQGPKLSKLLG